MCTVTDTMTLVSIFDDFESESNSTYVISSIVMYDVNVAHRLEWILDLYSTSEARWILIWLNANDTLEYTASYQSVRACLLHVTCREPADSRTITLYRRMTVLGRSNHQ